MRTKWTRRRLGPQSEAGGYQGPGAPQLRVTKETCVKDGGHPANSIPKGQVPVRANFVTLFPGTNMLGMRVADVGGPLHPVTNLPMLDIVTSGFTNQEASIFFQTAPRTFQQIRLNVGGQPAQIAIGDLNSDGRSDIAMTWGKDNLLAVYYRNPSPKGLSDTFFGPAVFPTSNTPVGAVIVDANHDGRPDVVVSARGANAYNVFLQR